MKKNTTVKRLGQKETEVIARLTYEKLQVVTQEQFKKLFGYKIQMQRDIIYQLKKKGILSPIKKGVYFFSPLESGPAGSRMNEFLIPSILFPKGNYYVGYSTMYNYYGFTDQIFQTIYVLNTAMQKRRIISGVLFKLIKVAPSRIYGIKKTRIRDSEVVISDMERTLVDLICFPYPVGGLKKAFDILKSQLKKKQIKMRSFIKYAAKFPKKSTRKRIGFVLEAAGVSDSLLKPLLNSVNKTSLITLYGSRSRAGAINNKWKVIIDDPYK